MGRNILKMDNEAKVRVYCRGVKGKEAERDSR